MLLQVKNQPSICRRRLWGPSYDQLYVQVTENTRRDIKLLVLDSLDNIIPYLYKCVHDYAAYYYVHGKCVVSRQYVSHVSQREH